MKYLRVRNEDGYVSLITCVFISLLLTIISLGIISIETVQLRKSEDAEQSVRAYYVAEAGIEAAAAKVLDGTITADQGCEAGTLPFDPTLAGWTCQQVEFTGTPFGNLSQPDVATTINPGTSLAQPFHSVIIQWGQSSDPNAADYTLPSFPAPPASYTTVVPSGVPPLEVSVVQYPAGGFTAGSAGLTLENTVLNPGGAHGGTQDEYNVPAFTTNSPVSAQCTPLGSGQQYNCEMILTYMGLPSNAYGYLFRLRSRYVSTPYKLTFMTGNDGTGNEVQVPTNTALIDVTAHVGTEYRRVVSELPIGNQASGYLNYVIYSDTNVCKDFNVINDTAQTPYPC